MNKVIITYEGDNTDSTIILVPDNVYSQIDELAQEYLDWIPTKENEHERAEREKHMHLIKDAPGFVRWLNKNYCTGNEKAIIKHQHYNSVKHIDF